MKPTDRSAIDTWFEFAVAVEFVAAIQQPRVTVWDALADALAAWTNDDGPSFTARVDAGDPLRQILLQTMDATPEIGAPGGVRVAEILDAAMSDWVERAASRINDGRPFTGLWSSND